MRIGHTTVRRNKRVMVFMRDGSKIIDRFLSSDDDAVYLKEHGRILKRKLRSVAIYKGI